MTIHPALPSAPDQFVIRIDGNVVRMSDAKPRLFDTRQEAEAWVRENGEDNDAAQG